MKSLVLQTQSQAEATIKYRTVNRNYESLETELEIDGRSFETKHTTLSITQLHYDR